MGATLLDRLLPPWCTKSGLSVVVQQICRGILINFVKLVMLLIFSCVVVIVVVLFYISLVEVTITSAGWAIWVAKGLYSYPEFRIDSAAVFDLETSGTDLTAVWNFTLVVANPDNGRLRTFDSTRAFVYYCHKRYLWHGHELDDYSIAKTRLPPFSVYPGNETRIDFKVGVTGAGVSHDQANKEISRGKTEVGLVKFGVMLSLQSKTYDYYCDPITPEVSQVAQHYVPFNPISLVTASALV